MQDKILSKLETIHALLVANETNLHSLYTETGGKILFLYEYAKLTGEQKIIEQFENALTQFAETFTQTPSTTFCSGIVGNMWLLEYFKKEGIVDDLLSEINVDLNKNFDDWGKVFIENKNYDFLHGLIGLIYGGNYCDVIDKSIIKAQTDSMLKDLKTEGSTMYLLDWMPNQEHDPEHKEKINFGLAHGIPASMIALSNIAAYNDNYKAAAIGIAEFILKHKRTEEKQSLYSSILYDRQYEDGESRLGWCYGDLGVALAFWQTGKLLQIEKYKDEAVNTMLHAAKRRELTINAVTDCGLCHGSAGIAHVFRRFYWETGNTVFKETADYWTEKTLEMAIHENGLAGYCAYRAIGEEPWIKEFGLLEGIAGIGLALIAALQEEPANWDQSLMMSS